MPGKAAPSPEELQRTRNRRGVDQDELAAVLDVHPGTLSRFETGQREDLPGERGDREYLAALDLCASVDYAEVASELGVSVSDLVRFTSARVRELPDGRGRKEYLEAFARVALRERAA